jgi:hypothetical protein
MSCGSSQESCKSSPKMGHSEEAAWEEMRGTNRNGTGETLRATVS